jgi:hypothetical protein
LRINSDINKLWGIAANYIKPASMYLQPGERPIVWFSKEQFWEPTVTKGWRLKDGTVLNLKMDDMLKWDILLVRIGFDPEIAPYVWGQLKALSGLSSDITKNLASTARECGANPSRWRGTFNRSQSTSGKRSRYSKVGNGSVLMQQPPWRRTQRWARLRTRR